MKRNIVVGGLIVLVLILVVLGFMLFHDHSAKKPTAASTSTPPTPATAVIEITPTGFVPRTLAVKPNTDVTWVNEAAMPHLPAADPYPTHKSLPDLVAPRALGQKETYTFLVTKTGTIHYHDDINPLLTGTIEVK